MSTEFDAPQSRAEAILQNMLGANNELEPPQSREEKLLLQILEQGGSGGGGASLPAVSAADNGSVLKVVSGAWDKGADDNSIPRVAKTSSDTTAAIDPNKLYVWPEMIALTVTLATPADANIANEYHLMFDSGSTPTTTSFPADILGLEDFAAEANTRYEISILEGCALITSWELPEVTT